jgi:diguanylate cyclase
MNVFALLSLSACIVHIMMGIYGIIINARSQLNRTFFAASVCCAAWAIGYFIAHLARTEEVYWRGYAVASPGWILMPSVVLHFFLILTGSTLIRRRLAYLVIYAPAAVFLARTVTEGRFMTNALLRTGLGWAEVPASTPWSCGYIVYMLTFTIAGLVMCAAWGLRTLSVREKKQGAIIILSIFMSLILIFTSEVFMPLAGIAPVPVLSPVFMLIWFMGIFFTMWRYRFMRITPALAADEILNTMVDVVIINDYKNRIIAVNQAAVNLLGLGAKELQGRPLAAIFPSAGIFSGESFSRELARGPIRNLEMEYMNASRRKLPLIFSASLISNAENAYLGAVSVLRDITELKQAQENLDYLAHHDYLTGLPNRLLFNDRMEQAIHYANRYKLTIGLLLIDLDRFKEINDGMGHETGDQVIVETARRISGSVRECDTVCRMGGDEFTCILTSIKSPEDPGIVAQRILDSFGKKIAMGNESITVSASIGIALYPGHSTGIEDLLKHADSAMYLAKQRGGRGFVVYGA